MVVRGIRSPPPFVANREFMKHRKGVPIGHIELTAHIGKQNAVARLRTRLLVRDHRQAMNHRISHKPAVGFSSKFGFGLVKVLRIALHPHHHLSVCIGDGFISRIQEKPRRQLLLELLRKVFGLSPGEQFNPDPVDAANIARTVVMNQTVPESRADCESVVAVFRRDEYVRV